MTRYIFFRDRLYLNWRLQWVELPQLLTEQEAAIVRETMWHKRNRPDGWAMVDASKRINLDALKFEPM